MTELNTHYQTYSEINTKQPSIAGLSSTANLEYNVVAQTNPTIYMKRNDNQSQIKQIHVFITGLNTCPTYCHVCQQIIPLIAYASKCQLCSFTCHSTCSTSVNGSATTGRKFNTLTTLNKHQINMNDQNCINNTNDPLKYCCTSAGHSLLIGLEYNKYLNKLISLELSGTLNTEKILLSSKSSNTILSDYVYLDINSKWRKGNCLNI